MLFYTRSIRDAVHSGRRTPCNPAPASSRTSDTPHNMTRRASFCFLSAPRADSFHNPYSFHIDRSFSPARVNSFVLMRNFFPLFFELCFQLIESVGNYGQKFVHRLELLLDGFSGCRFSLGGCGLSAELIPDTSSAGVIPILSAISSMVSERIFCWQLRYACKDDFPMPSSLENSVNDSWLSSIAARIAAAMFFCISKPINLPAIRIEKRSRKVKTSFPAYRTDFPARCPRDAARGSRQQPSETQVPSQAKCSPHPALVDFAVP